MPPSSNYEHFDIHASVVFQLGESLISDSVQALMELVKNSYDADATYCKLTISTAKQSAKSSAFPGALGSITIEDDGTGMSLEDIRRGWLTISNSEKREFKKKKLRTRRGRTPLGDKGLGRLGTQRLGDNIEILTRQEGAEEEHHLWFSWKEFIGQQRLSDVHVHYEALAPDFRRGTKLVVSDLRELSIWQGEAVKDLETRLSQMISPYKEARDFTVVASVDGKDLELLEIGDKLRRAAQLSYRISFDGDVLKLFGRAKLSYLRPGKNPDQEIFSKLVDADGGHAFFESLRRSKKMPPYSFSRLSDGGWFVSYEITRLFEDFDSLEVDHGSIANPGPFRGEVDFFNLGQEASAEQTVFATAAEYRQMIAQLSGIKVFRDGFGVRVDKDWLNLGSQWTKGQSYYGLKPDNTLGYIAISALDNPQLEETTDREGFKYTPYYANFLELLRYFVEFSMEAQEFLRRGWLSFRKDHEFEIANVPIDTSPEVLSQRISSSLARAEFYRASLGSLSERLTASSLASQSADLTRQPNSAESMALMNEAERLVQDVTQYLDEIGDLSKTAEILKQQIEGIREQIQQVYEIIGLGLTAEALSHEINNIATQLAQRNQQLIAYLRLQRIRDSKITSFTEYVKSTIAGLRKQMTFLAPSLQYVREKREVIDLEDFLDDMLKHYVTHFSAERIGVIPRFPKGQNFKIEMNRGKLVQILDNLVLNSEYWLIEDLRLHRIAQGTVTIDAEKPFLRVEDNGRGIDPSVEGSLFEPFVSSKGKGKGRGLGLYIVQQLLESEGCSIRLMPSRNKFGRMFCFEINLTGALIDKR